MLNTRHRIAPRVLIQELRGKHTSPPLTKLELDALVSAIKLTGVKDGFRRLSDDNIRYALDELAESI
jgi:hypothetical protein